MPTQEPSEFGTQQFEYSKRDKLYLVLTLVACLIILVIAALYVGYRLEQQSLNSQKPNTAVNVTTVPIANTYLGWHTYTDTIYNYLFKYPANWVLVSASKEISATSPSIVKFSTPEGYIFTFAYNAQIPHAQQQFVLYKSVIIDAKQFTKLYVNNCATTTDTLCRQKFVGILYDMKPDFSSNPQAFLSSLHNVINDKNLYLYLDLNGNDIQLNYPSFNTTNTALDQLIQSIKLPTI